MKKCITAIILFSFFSSAYSQQIDSIKYKYGYLYYHSYGKGEPIVALSGGPGNNALQLENMALKLSANYRVILLEQRGTGLSIPAPFDSTTITLNDALSDLNLLLTHLNIQKTILLGHSWGGDLALIYASQFPQKIKSLVLIAPGYMGMGWPNYTLFIDNLVVKLSVQEKQQLLDLSNRWQAGNLSDSEKIELAKLRRLPYIFDKPKLDSLMPILDGHTNDKTFRLLLVDAMKYDFDLKKDLQKIRSHIEIICGRQDGLVFVAYELKIARPDIGLSWIEKCGHFPMYEQPEAFYKVLDPILVKAKNSR